MQGFKECLTTEGDYSKCADLREDYMECLHHKKEVNAARCKPGQPGDSLCALRSSPSVAQHLKVCPTSA